MCELADIAEWIAVEEQRLAEAVCPPPVPPIEFSKNLGQLNSESEA